MLNMQKDQTIITDKIPDAIIEKTACIYRKARERGLGRGRETSAGISRCSLSSMQRTRNTK
jgi:transcription initiation factor TFIIIB Brf1 subunit/transcription initiation factor TFIIB